MWLELCRGDRIVKDYYFVAPPGMPNKAILKMPEWTFISEDMSNPMYLQYLAWVAEGNVAEEWNPDATE